MILREVNNVETTGIEDSKKFTIEASSKAFKILSKNLYSDSIKAIVREIGTNATDSAKLAGNIGVPFQVKLPNVIDNNFEIRDFGIGLSEEDIEGIYTTYFKSNKINSNELVGCFGLGSKSVFSYIDSFSVTSFFNGAVSQYCAFINEEGYPSIMKISEAETTEPNGLKISFPVKKEDFHDFEENVSKIYYWFDKKPVITNDEDFEFSEPDIFDGTTIAFDNPNWTVRKPRYANFVNEQNVSVLMGNVLYETDITHSNLLTLKMAIGEVDVTASREKLEMTKRTKEAIEQKIQQFEKDVSELVKNELEACECYFDACQYREEKLSIFRSIPLLYRGEKLERKLDYTYYEVSTSRRYNDVLKNNDVKQGYPVGNILFVDLNNVKSVAPKVKYLIQSTQRETGLKKVKVVKITDRIQDVNNFGILESMIIDGTTLKCGPNDKTSNTRTPGNIRKYQKTDRFSPGVSLVPEKYTKETNGVYIIGDFSKDNWERLNSLKTICKILGIEKNLYITRKDFNDSNMISLANFLESLKIDLNDAQYYADSSRIGLVEKVRDALTDEEVKILDKYCEVSKKMGLYCNLAILTNASVPKANDLREILDKYRLLLYIDSWTLRDDKCLEECVKYIKLVNNKENKNEI